MINGQKHSLFSKQPTKWSRRVVAQGDCVAPPMTEAIQPARVVLSSALGNEAEESIDFATESWETKPGLLVARTVLPNRSECLPIRVVNTSVEEIKIQSGTVLSDLEAVDLVKEGNNAEGQDERKAVLRNMVDRAHESLSAEDKRRLEELLLEFLDVFSFSENDLG